jgi:hypothetical protein
LLATIEMSNGLQKGAREQRSDVFSCVLSLGCGRRRRAKLSAHCQPTTSRTPRQGYMSSVRLPMSTKRPRQPRNSVSDPSRDISVVNWHTDAFRPHYPRLPHPEVRYCGVKTHGSPYTARNLGLAPRRLVEQGDLNTAKVRAQTSERIASCISLFATSSPSSKHSALPPARHCTHKVSFLSWLPGRCSSHLPRSRVPAPTELQLLFSAESSRQPNQLPVFATTTRCSRF